tara:strand:+ start:880 stop:1164 length:285 start_codon:yes stop_codon:yes gene_type:complete
VEGQPCEASLAPAAPTKEKDMEIEACVDWSDGDNKSVRLSINGDSRNETYETLVLKNEWGAFMDIEGFDPDNAEIQRKVEAACVELKKYRGEDA